MPFKNIAKQIKNVFFLFQSVSVDGPALSCLKAYADTVD